MKREISKDEMFRLICRIVKDNKCYYDFINAIKKFSTEKNIENQINYLLIKDGLSVMRALYNIFSYCENYYPHEKINEFFHEKKILYFRYSDKTDSFYNEIFDAIDALKEMNFYNEYKRKFEKRHNLIFNENNFYDILVKYHGLIDRIFENSSIFGIWKHTKEGFFYWQEKHNSYRKILIEIRDKRNK